jgi:hypothetical protein
MTNQQAREIFTRAAEAHRAAGNHDQAASAELMREYFTNPQFRKGLEDHVWGATNAAS